MTTNMMMMKTNTRKETHVFIAYRTNITHTSMDKQSIFFLPLTTQGHVVLMIEGWMNVVHI